MNSHTRAHERTYIHTGGGGGGGGPYNARRGRESGGAGIKRAGGLTRTKTMLIADELGARESESKIEPRQQTADELPDAAAVEQRNRGLPDLRSLLSKSKGKAPTPMAKAARNAKRQKHQ